MRQLEALRPSIDVLYDAQIRLSDRRLGGVVKLLEQRGLWDETLFFLVSDHGEEFGEHGGWQHDQSLYEELIRVPMLVHFPHREFAGRRIDEAVSLVDVLPTIFDYLGRPENADGSRGRSLLPLLRAAPPDDASRLPVPAFRQNEKKYFRRFKETRGDLNVALRLGRWKGVWNAEPDSFELYDLESDAAERSDLSAEHPERASKLKAAAQAWLRTCREESHRRSRPVEREIDAATEDRLRALGYLD